MMLCKGREAPHEEFPDKASCSTPDASPKQTGITLRLSGDQRKANPNNGNLLNWQHFLKKIAKHD